MRTSAVGPTNNISFFQLLAALSKKPLLHLIDQHSDAKKWRNNHAALRRTAHERHRAFLLINILCSVHDAVILEPIGPDILYAGFDCVHWRVSVCVCTRLRVLRYTVMLNAFISTPQPQTRTRSHGASCKHTRTDTTPKHDRERNFASATKTDTRTNQPPSLRCNTHSTYPR